jgi:hypothetical protein
MLKEDIKDKSQMMRKTLTTKDGKSQMSEADLITDMNDEEEEEESKS